MVTLYGVVFENAATVSEETERCTECGSTWLMRALVATNDGTGRLLCPGCVDAQARNARTGQALMAKLLVARAESEVAR